MLSRVYIGLLLLRLAGAECNPIAEVDAIIKSDAHYSTAEVLAGGGLARFLVAFREHEPIEDVDFLLVVDNEMDGEHVLLIGVSNGCVAKAGFMAVETFKRLKTAGDM